MRRRAQQVWLTVVCGLALAALIACGGKGGAPGPTKAAAVPSGYTGANVAVTQLAKMKRLTPESLLANIKDGKATTTVVALWATWCAPCIEEMPLLSTFHDAHKAKGVRVIGVCVDDPDELDEQIQDVLDKTKVGYEQTLLEAGSEEALMTALGESWDGMLPKTIVFDGAGKKQLFLSEAVTEAVLAEKIAPLVGAKP